MPAQRTLLLFVASLGALGSAARGHAESMADKAMLREPVALASVGEQLIVGNHRSGTLSIIDSDELRVVAEHAVAGRIADLAAVPNAQAAYVLDAENQALWLARFETPQLTTLTERLRLADIAWPDRVAASTRDSTVCVSSRWSRTVTLLELDSELELDSGPELDSDRKAITDRVTIALPFSPLEILFFDQDRKLLVADAFRGRLAVIDVKQKRLLHVHQLDGSNIRGLAIAGDRDAVYVSHQQLNSVGRTEFDDVHWGTLLAHVVRTIPIQRLLDPNVKLEECDDVWRETLGRVGKGTGDPGALWTDSRGAQAVAIAGTGELRISHSSYRMRFSVGKRPVALHAIDGTLFVANKYDDSISCVNLAKGSVEQTISLGSGGELSARDRGERLFFNARVAHDGWMSCHTCHSDGHTTDEIVDTLGDGDYGAPKRIPSLLGVGTSAPWGWNGTVQKLEHQVEKSVRTTMHGRRLSSEQVADLTVFLTSLPAPPTAAPQDDTTSDLVTQGSQLFRGLGCAECHDPDRAHTSAGTYDVGLQDELGRQQFNPPSLRGVSHRSKLFHDGRAAGLDEVLVRFRHQLEQPLTDTQRAQLLAYLRSL